MKIKEVNWIIRENEETGDIDFICPDCKKINITYDIETCPYCKKDRKAV